MCVICAMGGPHCHHFQVDKPGGSKRDLYVLIRNDVVHIVIVSRPVRDARLLRAVKKGFRLTPKPRMD